MNKKYGYIGKLKAIEGKGNELREILSKASEHLKSDPTCHLYLVSMKADEPETVYVTEVWESKEDQENSLKDETVKGLIGQAMPILDGMPEAGKVVDAWW